MDILVPTDFKPGSRAALERALASLAPEGGKIYVLHVIDQQFVEQAAALFPPATAAEVRTRLEAQAHQHYARLVEGLDSGRAELDFLVVEGVPFLKIVQLARDFDVDLIVMAAHRGPAYFEEFLFGSTTERVTRIAPCPVLIVPAAVTLQARTSGPARS
ncbi:MAG: universal stress protein [Candidatus Tectimicrobiota bacterium]|nr:MAG: universal stress protein [Candidatus Tectomicrobia bacterium]